MSEEKKGEKPSSKSHELLGTTQIFSEDIKAEINQIAEIVMDQRTKDFDSRVSELELSKAHLEDALQDLEKENEELRSLVLKQKVASAEQLAKMNKQLAEVAGELNSLGKVLKKEIERIAKIKRK